MIVIAGTNRPDQFHAGMWQQLQNLLNFHFPSLKMRERLWRIFLIQNQDGWSGAFEMLAKMSDGLGGDDIAKISQSSRQCSLTLGKRSPMPLASILLAIAKSSRGNNYHVRPNQLDGAERKLISDFVVGKGISEKRIDKILRFAADSL